MSLLSVELYTEYASDIDRVLKNKEKERILFNYQSPEIQYRVHLVNWIRSAAEKMKLSNTTLHLAVYLLDVFMDNHGIVPERLNLVTIVCLLLASKIEELDAKVPRITDLNSMIDIKYPVSDYICLEFMVMQFLKWNLILPTAAHFVEYYLAYAATSRDLKNTPNFDSYEQLQYHTQQYTKDFLDKSLMDIGMHRFHPSLVAASCIAAARQYLHLYPKWSRKLISITEYQFQDVQPCLSVLLGSSLKNDRKRKMTESPDHGYETGNSVSSSPDVACCKRSCSDHRNVST